MLAVPVITKYPAAAGVILKVDEVSVVRAPEEATKV